MGMINTLTVVFIALKLMGYIDWNWLLVLSPTICWFAIFVGSMWIVWKDARDKRRQREARMRKRHGG